MIRDPWVRTVLILVSAIAAIYLVGMVWQVVQQFADILLLFFLAWLLAFVLEPVVGWLSGPVRLPRFAAIGFTYVALLFVLSIGVVVLVPALSAQVVEMVRNLPSYAERVTELVTSLQDTVNTWLIEHRSPVLFDVQSALNPDELTKRIEALGPPLLTNVVQFATSAATILLEVVILLILSFYFMVDGPRLSERLILALPLRAQDDARFLVANIHRAFAGFLRGQVIQALTSALGTMIVMSALRVDYALLSAVVAGLFLLIPFLGPVVAVWLPVSIALITHPEVAWILLIALVALQQIILNVLAPRVLSQEVGLHPLLVFFAVLAGARVAGVWGAIFGVPVVAVVVTMASFYRANRAEQIVRLQEHLPGQDLVSADAQHIEPNGDAGSPPGISSRRRQAHTP